MELWEQLVVGALAILVLFLFRPGIKATIERSKNAEEKHWGTLALLAVALIAFVIFLISSVR
jgi:NADH:ubiquinone oxidoreductase subunit 6 (subunit J)